MSNASTTQTLDQSNLTENLFVRFFNKLKIINNCLVWQGSLNKAGYGQISHLNKTYLVHRFAYMISGQKLTKKDVLHHTCFNKACVNIDHLQKMDSTDHLILHRDLRFKQEKQNATTP